MRHHLGHNNVVQLLPHLLSKQDASDKRDIEKQRIESGFIRQLYNFFAERIGPNCHPGLGEGLHKQKTTSTANVFLHTEHRDSCSLSSRDALHVCALQRAATRYEMQFPQNLSTLVVIDRQSFIFFSGFPSLELSWIQEVNGLGNCSWGKSCCCRLATLLDRSRGECSQFRF